MTDTATTDTAMTDTATTSTVTTGTVTTTARPGADPTWTPVCALTDLTPERGVAALVDGEQIALFRLLDDTVLAVQQQDPYSGAHVMCRGIVGSRGGADTVASPMHKQVFDLRTGECLDPIGKDPRPLRTWAVRCADGVVHVARRAET